MNFKLCDCIGIRNDKSSGLQTSEFEDIFDGKLVDGYDVSIFIVFKCVAIYTAGEVNLHFIQVLSPYFAIY